MSGFDAGDVAENTANKTIERAMQSVYEPISTLVGVGRAKFFEDFSKYYKYVYSKCANVRTILSKSKSEPIERIYVPSSFRCEKVKYSDLDIVKKVRKLERIVVKGNGGTGKTIFFKFLWLSLFNEPQGKIPLFVELRRLNDITSPNISAFCRSELQSSAIFSDPVFEKLCQQGKFIFIFDGFDELERSVRPVVEKQIIQMSYQYQNCGFVLSSRDDDRFSSWQGFTVYGVCDLSLDEAKKIIEKIDFEPKSKRKFLDGLTKEFYERHQHFLSSPLLVTMMLMTFYQNASIPDRLSSFYKNAFHTLLLWHDATKDSYERERFLSLENFRVLFSIFCLISYYKESHDFEEETLRGTIKKSIQYAQNMDQLKSLKDSDIEAVKLDFWQSANLLQKDGIIYSFLHRSFQEYFAAECVMTILNDGISELLSKFASRHTDKSLEMCFEIHPDKVIDEYIKPCYSRLLEAGVFRKTILKNEESLLQLDISLVFEREGRIALSKFGSISPFRHFDDILALSRLTPDVELNVFENDGFSAVGRVLRSIDTSKLEKSDYELGIRANGVKDVSVSIRATGKKKIPLREINELKRSIADNLSKELDVAEKRFRRRTAEIGKAVEDLLQSRSNREKSIEEILGI